MKGFILSVRKKAATIAILALAITFGPAIHSEATLEPKKNPAAHQDAFPLPAALEPAVSFWCRVFGEWRRDQIALHDAEHLAVVYQVLQIPGPVDESLTTGQRLWVKAQESRLSEELTRITQDLARGRKLAEKDRNLVNKLKTAGAPITGADKRVRAQRGVRERFLMGLQKSGRYERSFREVFRSQGLPEDLAYLPHVESSFNNGARSSVGAAGMWQFMPSTARSYMKVHPAVDERLNPVTAARGAARYFAGAYRSLGSWPLAITSYNHGIGGMRRAKERFGNDFSGIVRSYDAPSFGFASRNFYVEFLAARRIARAPGKYFPEGVRYEPPISASAMTLPRSMSAHEVGKHAGMSVSTLASLNPGWTPQALKGRKTLPSGTIVWLPKGKTLAKLPPSSTVASRAVAARKAPMTQKHRVARGESLWSISRLYGVGVEALKAENGLGAKSHIRIGSVLTIPGKTASDKKIVTAANRSKAKPKKTTTARTHRVKRGETPVGIASAYRVPLKALLAANNMNGRSLIHPGQKLTIPTRQ